MMTRVKSKIQTQPSIRIMQTLVLTKTWAMLLDQAMPSNSKKKLKQKHSKNSTPVKLILFILRTKKALNHRLRIDLNHWFRIIMSPNTRETKIPLPGMVSKLSQLLLRPKQLGMNHQIFYLNLVSRALGTCQHTKVI